MPDDAVVEQGTQQGQEQSAPAEPQDRFEDFTISEQEVGNRMQSPTGGKETPPPAEQTAGKEGVGNEGKQSPSGDKAGQENAVSEDDLKKSLSFSRTPEEEQKSLQTQLSAASKESRWQNAVNKQVQDILAQQGIELSVDKVKNDKNEDVPNISLSVKKGYKPEADSFSFDWNSLSEDKKEDFLDNPQQLIDTVVDKAKEAFVRALPAGEKKLSVEPDKVDAAFEFLGKMTDVDGDPRYPGLDDNRQLIQAMIDDPAMSDGVKTLLAKDPQSGVELLNARVNHERNRLLSKAEQARKVKEEKETFANQNASAMPANAGTQRKAASTAGQDYFAEYV